jgi:hypothetical protein
MDHLTKEDEMRIEADCAEYHVEGTVLVKRHGGGYRPATPDDDVDLTGTVIVADEESQEIVAINAWIWNVEVTHV